MFAIDLKTLLESALSLKVRSKLNVEIEDERIFFRISSVNKVLMVLSYKFFDFPYNHNRIDFCMTSVENLGDTMLLIAVNQRIHIW